MDLDSIYPHLVTPVLFLGPLYAKYLGSTLPFQKLWTFETNVVKKFGSWQGARNFLLVRSKFNFRAVMATVDIKAIVSWSLYVVVEAFLMLCVAVTRYTSTRFHSVF